MKKELLTCVLCLLAIGAEAQATSTVTPQRVDERPDSLLEARLDSIEMEAELHGVSVTAQRSLVKNDIDRIAYDVQADTDSRTMTVLDMLRKVPYVTVDGEDNIKVKGSSAFRIYRNGHQDPSLSRNAKEIFKAMPATMVKRIEVITEPGAKEDAEGVDAILNIVFVENKKVKGSTGSITGSYNSLNHPNVGAYLMAQMGKFTTSVDYGYGGMARRETESYVDSWTQYSTTGNQALTTDHSRSPGYVHYADVNASLEIDTLNLLSASVGGYFYNLNIQGDQQTRMENAAGQMLYAFAGHYWMPDYLHHSWQGRMDYEHRSHRQGERLTASYMLALTRQNTENEETYSDMQYDHLQYGAFPIPYTGFLSCGKERFVEHTLQLDWLRPLGHGHQLETGTKYIYRYNRSRNMQNFYAAGQPDGQSDSQVGTGVQDTETRFRHRTQVGAVYCDYIYRHQRWSARAGLRYEFSRMGGEGFHRHYHDLVPQASAKWQMSDRHSMKFGYTTSIRRPGIEYLNPAVDSSPLRMEQGNARLKSSRLQTAHLIYMYIGQRLTLNVAPAYKWSRNGIASIRTTEGDVRHTAYGNVQNYRRLQLEGYVQWKPWEKTTIVLNANAGLDRCKNTAMGLAQKTLSGFLYGYVMQEMWWRLRFTVAGYGQLGREISGVYGYSEPWWAGSINMQRSFLKEDRLTIRLGANVPFTKFKDYTYRVVQGYFTQMEHREMRSRAFTLSVSFRFGRLASNVKKAEKSIENDDVVGGITKGR